MTETHPDTAPPLAPPGHGPAVETPEDAAHLLLALDGEAAALLAAGGGDAYERAGYQRRRAYVLDRCARMWPQYAPAALLALGAWRSAEVEAVRHAVEDARAA